MGGGILLKKECFPISLKTYLMKLSLKSFRMMIAVVMAASFSFISCEDNTEPVKSTKTLIATMSSYRQDGKIHESRTLSYDSNGRLVEIKSNDEEDNFRVTFEYTASAATMKYYYKDTLDEVQVYQLNNKGLCISIVTEDNGTENSSYDDNGYLKTVVETEGNYTSTDTYTVSNKNYVTIATESKYTSEGSAKVNRSVFDGLSALLKTLGKRNTTQNTLKSASDFTNSYRSEFQFYTDKINTIGFENMGVFFFGKQNNNPVMHEIHTSSYERSDTTTYRYEYDAKGRIARQIWEHGGYDVYTYIE